MKRSSTRPKPTPKAEAVMGLKPNTVAWCKALVQAYMQVRSQMVEPWWALTEQMYEQRQFQDSGWWNTNPDSLANKIIEPPRVYGIVHGIESAVYNRSPKFFVKPNTAEVEDLAIWSEMALNADWQRDYQLNREFRLAIRSCAKTGWGVMLTSYETDYDVAEASRKKRQKRAEKLAADPMLALASNGIAPLIDQDEEEVDTQQENDDRVRKDRTSSRWISSWDFLIDADSTALENAKWCGRQYRGEIESIKACPWFKNTKNLMPTMQADYATRSGNRNQNLSSQPYQYVTIYELFIKQTDGSWDLKVVAEGHDEFLREVTAPYDFGCPYKLLRWNETGGRIFSISDIQPVHTHILEERELRTRLYDATMREAEDLHLCDGQVFNENEAFPVISIPGVGLVIRVENANGKPLETMFARLRKDNKTGPVIEYLSIIERNIQDGIGMGPNQNLQAMKSETSATEAGIVNQASQARGQAKHVAAEEFAAGIAHQRLSLAAQFYDDDDIKMLAGVEAAKIWETKAFTKVDIQNGLSVTVQPGSMKPQSDDTRYALLTQMLSEAQAAPALFASLYNVPEVARRRALLAGIPDGSKLLQSQVSGPGFAQAATQMALMTGGGGGAQGSPPAPAKGRSHAAPAMAAGM